VLAKYTEWKGATHIGEPLLYGIKFVNWLKERGCYVIIFSCRTNGSWRHTGEDYWEVESIMRKWLLENNVWYDQIAQPGQGKVYADVYVDDRAISWPCNLGGRGQEDCLELSLFLQMKRTVDSILMR